jgi:TonB-linked SusC/RagA family outer membrane protein
VQVTSSSGSPGSSAYITIRGAASISGDNQPLFIVDGVPVSNALSDDWTGFSGVDLTSRITDINPGDIQSVSVLKGGAATALYGIRAANGAIIITTKEGIPTDGKKVNISFQSSLSFDRVSQLPELQTRYGQGFNGDWISGNFASWGPRLDTCSYSKNPDDWTYPEYDVNGAIVGTNSEFATDEPVNIYDQYEFFQTGISTNNTLSLSGGSDVATFYTSASYTNTTGVVPNSNWKRFTVKVAGDANLTKKFKILGSLNYMKTGGDRMQKGYNWSGVMLGLLRTPATFDNAAGYELPDGTQRNYMHGGGYDNPYWSVNKNLFKDDVNRVIGYIGFNWFITKWMQVDYKLGGDFYNAYNKNYYAIGSNEYSDGAVFVNSLNQRDINSDLMVQIDHRFTKQWVTRLRLGHNMYETYVNNVEGIAYGLELPGFYDLSNSADVKTSEYGYQIRRAAIYGDLEVSYNQMVYLTLTGRNDWSTTLPKNNNSFFYPSASIGFIFTELDFLKDNKILPFGKLRFSVARIANDPLQHQTITTYNRADIWVFYTKGWNGLSFPLLGETGFTLSNTQGNPELEPELTTSWEIGADLKFLKNRLGVDFTYFNNYSDGLLLPVRMSGASGFYQINMNAAGMSTKGMEAVLYGNPIHNSNWHWDLTFNFTRYKNRVEKIPENMDGLVLGAWGDPWVVAKEGYPYQSFFGYDWYRDENGNVLIDDDPESSGYGFPVGINFDEQIYLGQVNPDWVLGWANKLKWENIILTFLLEYKKGGNMFNGTLGSLYYYGAHKDQENREPGDEVIFEGVKASDGSPNDIEVIKGQNWYFQGQGSDITGMGSPYIEDAGWIRLREVALTYSLGKGVLKDGVIKGLDIYFACKNLWLQTKYSGIDPETSLHGATNMQGIDYYNMPGTKSYTLGVRASF